MHLHVLSKPGLGASTKGAPGQVGASEGASRDARGRGAAATLMSKHHVAEPSGPQEQPPRVISKIQAARATRGNGGAGTALRRQGLARSSGRGLAGAPTPHEVASPTQHPYGCAGCIVLMFGPWERNPAAMRGTMHSGLGYRGM